ncbi:hypothetical protein PR202_gb29794 [Eleusine coracana subsp. coracana]|uniref:Uncharacterized protein n=1 Tax=Eleusine coracana subsp. coracana TaxID=191504 RepID=A0AAV5G072_ELECO|nr:hypothetical protein PR202_gb29794 [Eleusine coracana subsp. coracana]
MRMRLTALVTAIQSTGTAAGPAPTPAGRSMRWVSSRTSGVEAQTRRQRLESAAVRAASLAGEARHDVGQHRVGEAADAVCAPAAAAGGGAAADGAEEGRGGEADQISYPRGQRSRHVLKALKSVGHLHHRLQFPNPTTRIFIPFSSGEAALLGKRKHKTWALTTIAFHTALVCRLHHILRWFSGDLAASFRSTRR